MNSVPSLDGRCFAPAEVGGDGQVGRDTLFEYHQDGDLIWARYAGGAIKLGHLVGTRSADSLTFRYAHVDTEGATAAGRCETRLEVLPDGRIALDERWHWESRPGAGTSRLIEVGSPTRPGASVEPG